MKILKILPLLIILNIFLIIQIKAYKVIIHLNDGYYADDLNQYWIVDTINLPDKDIIIVDTIKPVNYFNSLPEVYYAEQDNESVELDYGWGQDRTDSIKIDANYNSKYTGKGVEVYIVDTNVLTTHKEFLNKKIELFKNFVLKEKIENPHGTHVTSILAGNSIGISPGVSKIKVLRVMSETGRGLTSDTIKALYAISTDILDNNIKKAVVNLSISMTKSPSVDIALIYLKSIFDKKEHQGAIVAAAGNFQNDACLYYPSGHPDVITVGSLDINDNFWSGSNFGKCLQINAPGVNIRGATVENDKYTFLTGTSMATPIVAGVVAQLLEIGYKTEEIPLALDYFSLKDHIYNLRRNTLDRIIQIPTEYVSLCKSLSKKKCLLVKNICKWKKKKKKCFSI